MKVSNNAGQSHINILIVVISDQHGALKEDALIAFKDIGIADLLVIRPTQIALVNEAIVKNEQFSDLFIACENQLKEFDGFSKMLRSLYSCEKHGAAVSLSRSSRGIGELTKEQYDGVSKYLGNYRVIPYIESVPALIKGELFERFGGFDENFNSIEGALGDFSLRFNQYGWSTVRVNCWSNVGSSTIDFTSDDADKLQKRYPYLHEIDEIYYRRAEKAAEHFADVLVPENERKPSLLYSAYGVPASFNGTANHALSLLAAFYNCYHEKYEISILVKRNADEFHGLSNTYPQVYYPETVREHTFQLGFVVSQILCAEHMDIINQCCLKYGVWMLDIISLRSHYLCKNDPSRYDLFRDSLEYADLMLASSQFSHDDIIGFFHDELQNATLKTGVSYLGTDKELAVVNPEAVTKPFDTADYFIVIGNAYKHKMIEPVLEILKNVEENFIVIGTKTEGYYPKSRRIYGYVSGWLTNDSLNQMIAGAKAIIFPSVYEGFGLTLFDAAACHKKIIVSDTQINFELKELLGQYSSNIITFRGMEELRTILSETDFDEIWNGKTTNLRSWQETAKELDGWLESMREEETDIARLERRWRYLKRYQEESSDVSKKQSSIKKERLIRKCISSFPRTYQLYRKLVTAIDKEHYGSR